MLRELADGPDHDGPAGRFSVPRAHALQCVEWEFSQGGGPILLVSLVDVFGDVSQRVLSSIRPRVPGPGHSSRLLRPFDALCRKLGTVVAIK